MTTATTRTRENITMNAIKQVLTIKAHHFTGGLHYGVNARDLHKALGVGRDFSNWIKARLRQANFIDGEDFLIVQNSIIDSPKRASAKGGNLRALEYVLTTDTAKHICLMERNNAIAHVIRQYFIDSEKKLTAIAPKVVKRLREQALARIETIDPTKAMNEALAQHLTRQGKDPLPKYFCNETEMLESLILGVNVRTWKKAQGITDSARNHFTAAQLAQLKALISTNTALLTVDMPYSDRKARLQGLAEREVA